MKLKILILKGGFCSGKSTWSKSICKAAPMSWMRVCRDDIRAMAGKDWVPKREFLITSIENSAVYEGLSAGFNIIIDSTNLNKRDYHRWTVIAKQVNEELGHEIEIEFKDFEVSLNKAIWRDWWRGFKGGRKVGKKVVTNFYRKYYAQKVKKDS